MGTEIKIGTGFAEITVSITEFVSVIKALTGAIKDEEFRTALAEMIPEVRRSYETAVDAFTPFYALDKRKKFTKNFSENRAEFKKTYLKDITAVRTHCGKVTEKLNDLRKSTAWKSKVPYLKRSVSRLEDLAGAWIENDQILASNMEWLLKSLNLLLNEVARIQKRDSEEAYKTLTDALDDFETFFLAVNAQLGKLDKLSNKLM